MLCVGTLVCICMHMCMWTVCCRKRGIRRDLAIETRALRRGERLHGADTLVFAAEGTHSSDGKMCGSELARARTRAGLGCLGGRFLSCANTSLGRGDISPFSDFSTTTADGFNGEVSEAFEISFFPSSSGETTLFCSPIWRLLQYTWWPIFTRSDFSYFNSSSIPFF